MKEDLPRIRGIKVDGQFFGSDFSEVLKVALLVQAQGYELLVHAVMGKENMHASCYLCNSVQNTGPLLMETDNERKQVIVRGICESCIAELCSLGPENTKTDEEIYKKMKEIMQRNRSKVGITRDE